MKIRKIITVLITFSLGLLLFTGCSLFAKPEETVEEELTAIKNLDGEAISRYMSYEDLFDYDTEDELPEDATEVFDIILKGFDYKVLSTEKVKKEATVRVELTIPDMEPIVKSYIKTTMHYVLLQDINEDDADDELDLDQLFTILKDILDEEYETTTCELDMKLEKIEGEWTILPDDEIGAALTGYFSQIMDDPYLVTAKETAEITLDTIAELGASQIKSFLLPGNVISDDGLAEEILVEKIAKYFSYKIISTETTGDDAVVEAEITNIDLAGILPRYEELLNDFATNYGGVMPSDDEIMAASQDCFRNALREQEATKVFTVEIHFTNDGELWILDSNEEFVDVMLGGLNDLEKRLIAMSQEGTQEETE